MPVIRFIKNHVALEVKSGASLMESLLAGGMPVASSCHGDGICGKCRIQIVEGASNLTAINAAEQILRERLKVAPDQRISCQTQVNGDIVVDTSYW